MASKIEIFFCYAHKDEELLNKLKAHLKPLQRQGLIDIWHDRKIDAGKEWADQIDAHLKTAEIMLLLVSPDFIASDYCYDIEMKQALEKHEKGEAVVIPIVFRPCDWQKAPFGKLKALPIDGKPVTMWPDRDNAFLDVARGIRKVVEGFAKKQRLDEGNAYYQVERYEEALTSFQEAINLDPSFTLAYNGKGNALANLERYEEALAAYEKAISLDINFDFAYYNEGVLRFKLEDYHEALACFEYAINLDPHFVGNYIYNALVLERIGKLKEAIDISEKYLRLHFNDKVFDFKTNLQEQLETQHDIENQRLDVENLEGVEEVYDRIRDKRSDDDQDVDVNQVHYDEQFTDINHAQQDFYESDKNQDSYDWHPNQDQYDGQFADINQDRQDFYEPDKNQEHEERQYINVKQYLEIKFSNIQHLKDSEAKRREIWQLNEECRTILDLLNDARKKLEDKDREARRLQDACYKILSQLSKELQLRYEG